MPVSLRKDAVAVYNLSVGCDHSYLTTSRAVIAHNVSRLDPEVVNPVTLGLGEIVLDAGGDPIVHLKTRSIDFTGTQRFVGKDGNRAMVFQYSNEKGERLYVSLDSQSLGWEFLEINPDFYARRGMTAEVVPTSRGNMVAAFVRDVDGTRKAIAQLPQAERALYPLQPSISNGSKEARAFGGDLWEDARAQQRAVTEGSSESLRNDYGQVGAAIAMRKRIVDAWQARVEFVEALISEVHNHAGGAIDETTAHTLGIFKDGALRTMATGRSLLFNALSTSDMRETRAKARQAFEVASSSASPEALKMINTEHPGWYTADWVPRSLDAWVEYTRHRLELDMRKEDADQLVERVRVRFEKDPRFQPLSDAELEDEVDSLIADLGTRTHASPRPFGFDISNSNDAAPGAATRLVNFTEAAVHRDRDDFVVQEIMRPLGRIRQQVDAGNPISENDVYDVLHAVRTLAEQHIPAAERAMEQLGPVLGPLAVDAKSLTGTYLMSLLPLLSQRDSLRTIAMDSNESADRRKFAVTQLAILEDFETLRTIFTDYTRNAHGLVPRRGTSRDQLRTILSDPSFKHYIGLRVYENASVPAARAILTNLGLPPDSVSILAQARIQKSHSTRLVDGKQVKSETVHDLTELSPAHVASLFPEYNIEVVQSKDMWFAHGRQDDPGVGLTGRDVQVIRNYSLNPAEAHELAFPYETFKAAGSLAEVPRERVSEIRSDLNIGERPVIVLGSPSGNEVKSVLGEYDRLYGSLPVHERPLIVLGMRDPVEFKNNQYLVQYGAFLVDVSNHEVVVREDRNASFPDMSNRNMLILNTRGELTSMYATGDIAIVGHDRNLVETAAQKTPILTFDGAWTNNLGAKRLLEEEGGLAIFNGQTFEHLMDNRAERDQLANRATMALQSLGSAEEIAENLATTIGALIAINRSSSGP